MYLDINVYLSNIVSLKKFQKETFYLASFSPFALPVYIYISVLKNLVTTALFYYKNAER